MISKKILDSAYKDYVKANRSPLSRVVWEAKITGKELPKEFTVQRVHTHTKKPKFKKPAKPKPARTWLSIQREYLRWRKTDDFLKWKHKQFLKQGGTCYYCDQPLPGLRVNVEHIVPKSKGGDNRKSNLVLSCSGCNKEKNTTVLTRKVKDDLRVKNKAKKGTYHTLKEAYPSELDIAYKLRDMFKED